MRDLFSAMLANPRRTAILVGIGITLLLSVTSFPDQRYVEETVQGWLPPNNVTSGATADLLNSLEAADPRLVHLSEEAFRELAPAAAVARTVISQDGRDFVIQYLGATGNTLYAAQRQIERRRGGARSVSSTRLPRLRWSRPGTRCG